MIREIKNNMILVLVIMSFSLSNNENLINRPFQPSGRIDAMVNQDSDDLKLIQLNLKNDSLYNIADSLFPDLELLNGPASYHRILTSNQLSQIQPYFNDETLYVINDNYDMPNESRLYWVEIKPGSQVYGTYTEDEAIEYTCACIDGDTDDCIKLGYDDSWYNPFDYYGEAWWAFTPPNYDYIQEIRVTVRGAQCDDLPLWSETYMGLKDNNGSWSNDYELSINYTDNIFIVPETWNQGMLMPTIGSEDNYVIDYVKFEFFYSCMAPDEVISFQASDGDNCSTINLEWDFPTSDIEGFQLFKEGDLIFESNDLSNTSFIDYSAESGEEYEYCMYTYDECSISEPICNIGFVKPIPASVDSVASSDGEYPDEIHISWNEAENSDGYRLYRDGTWLSVFYPHQDLVYIDEYIDSGETYNYCIESYNDCGDAAWTCDLGFGGAYLGDSNFDGNIDVLDVVTLVNFILSINEPSESQLFWLDMNQDGSLNVQDVVLIVNIILN
tara:strand:+ start:651 stop:2147 length:1497 start_codon:yes stop_codon:yes gene_type:complete